MATQGFPQRLPASDSGSYELGTGANVIVTGVAGRSLSASALWIIADALTVVGAAALAIYHENHTGSLVSRGFVHGTLLQNRSIAVLAVLLGGFTITLILTSRRLLLYSPTRLNSIVTEQGRSIQACFTAALLLAGMLYLFDVEDISRNMVLITVGLVTGSLSLRRLLSRLRYYRYLERGLGVRNVLIVGTGPEAQALRHHIDSIGHLGYSFKGFIDCPSQEPPSANCSDDVIGMLETLFQSVRRQFVDEIFITGPCEPGILQRVLEQSRIYGVDLRVVPHLYDGLAWECPIEYVGQFPTIPIHRGRVPEIALAIKRGLDILLSGVALVLLLPAFGVISLAVKLDSAGPVFFTSERIGKKGRVFRCTKFRTMVRDADKRRADVLHMNERDGVLFKIARDPRITRIGRVLRQYSLDELPQLLSVLRGDMSLVGPRPPLACEVQEYKLSDLRRLDVKPGLTGLWQVQARQDPSFDSYISLDMAYIENWNLWLDFTILARTVGVVLQGTGS